MLAARQRSLAEGGEQSPRNISRAQATSVYRNVGNEMTGDEKKIQSDCSDTLEIGLDPREAFALCDYVHRLICTSKYYLSTEKENLPLVACPIFKSRRIYDHEALKPLNQMNVQDYKSRYHKPYTNQGTGCLLNAQLRTSRASTIL